MNSGQDTGYTRRQGIEALELSPSVTNMIHAVFMQPAPSGTLIWVQTADRGTPLEISPHGPSTDRKIASDGTPAFGLELGLAGTDALAQDWKRA